LASPWTRTFSLAAAGAISLVLMLDPYALRGVSLSRVHEGLPLLLLGVSGAFIHGFGFRPTIKVIRAFANPIVIWSFLIVGAALMAPR
jgi:predicted membrane protein